MPRPACRQYNAQAKALLADERSSDHGDAMNQGYDIFVLQDAVRGMDADASNAALEEMVHLGAKLIDFETIVPE